MVLLSLVALLLVWRLCNRVDHLESVDSCSCRCDASPHLGTAPLVFNDPWKQGGRNNE